MLPDAALSRASAEAIHVARAKPFAAVQAACAVLFTADHNAPDVGPLHEQEPLVGIAVAFRAKLAAADSASLGPWDDTASAHCASINASIYGAVTTTGCTATNTGRTATNARGSGHKWASHKLQR